MTPKSLLRHKRCISNISEFTSKSSFHRVLEDDAYSKVNNYGFIETPYRIVNSGRVTNKVLYLSAIDEEDFVIAQANAEIHLLFPQDNPL